MRLDKRKWAHCNLPIGERPHPKWSLMLVAIEGRSIQPKEPPCEGTIQKPSCDRRRSSPVSALILASRSTVAAGDVDLARLRAAGSEPQNWFTLGRDQNQTYYSPLAKIDTSNVSRLGFAWAHDLGTAHGQEATPLVIDGIRYTSGTWGYV